MASWRGIEYVESSPQGPSEQYATDASRVLRTLFFPGQPSMADRYRIAQQFLGYAEVKTNPISFKRYVSRTTPHYYPSIDFDIDPHLYCQSLVQSEMVTADDAEDTLLHAAGDKTATSAWWKAVFEYRTLPGDVKEDSAVLAEAGELYDVVPTGGPNPDEGDALRRGWANTRYIAKVVEPGGRVIPLRHGAFLFGDGKPSMEPFAFNETLQNITYFWSGVPLDGYPLQTVQTLLNTVNADVFDGYYPGTLLLIDAREVPRRDAFGQRTLDATYRMLFAPRCNALGNPLGHNAILRISPIAGPIWQLLSADGVVGSTKRPYRSTDFSRLFHPDQP